MSLYDYVFHFNPYQGIWHAIPRNMYMEYFNNDRKDLKGVLKSKNIDVLVEMITKGEEFINKI